MIKRDDERSRLAAALGAQNIVVGKARNEFLAKKAEHKHLEAKWIDAAEGKSIAERTNKVRASDEWFKLSSELARAEAVYEFERFKLDILDKEWLAAHDEQKAEREQIRRGVG